MPIEADKDEVSILPEFVEGRELHIPSIHPLSCPPRDLVSLVHPSTPVLDQASLPTTAIVKLYDRRCFTNTREDHDEGAPWSPDKGREYRQYLNDVATGALRRGDFASPTFFWDNDVSEGEFEAYFQYQAQKIFDTECAAYERLQPFQGEKIPKLYGIVEHEISIPSMSSEGPDIVETIPGLLIEYIPGLTLRQLVATWKARDPPLPNGVLAALCEQAVRVVDRVSDFDVLNEDVRVNNFLVCEPFVDSSSSAVVEDAVVLVDFGQSRLRREDESEEDWAKAKWSQDETGAVGLVALKLVREFVGDDVWSYERSLRYYRPLEE